MTLDQCLILLAGKPNWIWELSKVVVPVITSVVLVIVTYRLTSYAERKRNQEKTKKAAEVEPNIRLMMENLIEMARLITNYKEATDVRVRLDHAIKYVDLSIERIISDGEFLHFHQTMDLRKVMEKWTYTLENSFDTMSNHTEKHRPEVVQLVYSGVADKWNKPFTEYKELYKTKES